jgi:hypothetical protein
MSLRNINKLKQLTPPSGIEEEPNYGPFEIASPLLFSYTKLCWDTAEGDIAAVLKHLVETCRVKRGEDNLRKWIKRMVKLGNWTDYASKIGPVLVHIDFYNILYIIIFILT